MACEINLIAYALDVVQDLA